MSVARGHVAASTRHIARRSRSSFAQNRAITSASGTGPSGAAITARYARATGAPSGVRARRAAATWLARFAAILPI